MNTIGMAFFNKVLAFYTFYRYVCDPFNFFQTVAFIHFQLEIFWSFLVLTTIITANKVTREVNKSQTNLPKQNTFFNYTNSIQNLLG